MSNISFIVAYSVIISYGNIHKLVHSLNFCIKVYIHAFSANLLFKMYVLSLLILWSSIFMYFNFINQNNVFINMRGNRYSNDSRNLKTVSMYISISTHRKYHCVMWNIVLVELHYYEVFSIGLVQTFVRNEVNKIQKHLFLPFRQISIFSKRTFLWIFWAQ